MNVLFFSFLFSIPIAIWIFKNNKTNPNHIHISKCFFIHCLFLIFATTIQINYHINYLGIISYLGTSCFVLFCVCNDLFTKEEINKIRKIIIERNLNNN